VSDNVAYPEDSPALAADADAVAALSTLWWLTLGIGLLSMIVGVIVLIKPGNSLATIAVIVGIFILVDGLLALLASLRHATESRGLAALVGVLSIVVGVLLIRHPIQGVVAVALLVGIWLLVMGVVRLVQSFDAAEHRLWRMLVAAIEIVAGIVIVSSPDIGVATLALLVGISLIVNGAALTTLGAALHSARDALTPHAPHRAAPAA
jgi:uncharacterized membrane protein HdeD (DUF308 family)